MRKLNLSRSRIDFAVGLFVLFALVAVVFVALRVANIASVSAGDGYVLHVNFDNIGSLVERSPVKSSGVKIGRVQKIAYDTENFSARVDLVIDDDYLFPSDSTFSIVSSNLLGGQYIAVEVGAEDRNFQENDVIEGNSAIVLEELISKFLFDKAGE